MRDGVARCSAHTVTWVQGWITTAARPSWSSGDTRHKSHPTLKSKIQWPPPRVADNQGNEGPALCPSKFVTSHTGGCIQRGVFRRALWVLLSLLCPEPGAPWFAYMLRQKHLFSLVPPVWLIPAELLHSFHFPSSGNSLVLLVQYGKVALLKAKPGGKFASCTVPFDGISGTWRTPREAAVTVGASTFGRTDLHAACYCLLLRTKAWSTHELCIIPLPVDTAGGSSKCLLVFPSGKKVVFAFLASTHF